MSESELSSKSTSRKWEIIDAADGEVVATTPSEEKAEEFDNFGNMYVTREVEADE